MRESWLHPDLSDTAFWTLYTLIQSFGSLPRFFGDRQSLQSRCATRAPNSYRKAIEAPIIYTFSKRHISSMDTHRSLSSSPLSISTISNSSPARTRSSAPASSAAARACSHVSAQQTTMANSSSRRSQPQTAQTHPAAPGRRCRSRIAQRSSSTCYAARAAKAAVAPLSGRAEAPLQTTPCSRPHGEVGRG